VTAGLPSGAELPGFAAAQLVAFVLVLGRVAPLFLLAPVLSATTLAARAKFLVAAAVSVAIAPVAAEHRTVPVEPLAFALALAHEAAVGLAIALALGALGAAIQAGASLLDTLSGFSLGAVVDPVAGGQSAVLGQVYSLFAAMVFLLTGGVRLMIAAVARSYDLVPLGAAPARGRLAALALDALSSIPLIGLELVAPVIVALVVTDAAFGLLARAVPQLNVLVIGLPAKVLLAFGVIAASLPFVGARLRDDLVHSLAQALGALGS